MIGLLPLQRDNRWLNGVGQILLHVCVTLLAVAIAFSLPAAAQYILFQWWPRVAEDANLLVATEVGLAGTLVLLFNLTHIAWRNRYKVRIAEAASLVYVRKTRDWIARWRERRLVKRLPAMRDASILTLTGFDTFAGPESVLHEPLKNAYEIRVMLLNPGARSAARRVDSLSPAVTLHTYASEIDATIGYLEDLRLRGKKVALKFYEDDPFWKIAVLGDHVWVQYCHDGVQIKEQPEYVFALNPENPKEGFFAPFYMYFLERWIDNRHPQYDFDTRELVYRDAFGRETRRVRFAPEGTREEPRLADARTHMEGGAHNARGTVFPID